MRPPRRGASGQTALYEQRADELVRQLRGEIWAPATPHGAPAVVVMIGLPGVGKTHVARLLAASLGSAHVASDHLRSRLFIAPSYADAENRMVFHVLDRLLERLLEERHRVIVDATHLAFRSRAATEATARRRGVPLTSVRVVADEASVRDHLARRRDARSAGDHSEADDRIYRRIARQEFEPPPEYLLVRNGPDLEADLARVVALVEERCARGI